MSKIGGTALAKYTASTDINLAATYSEGTYTSGDTTYTITSMDAMGGNTTIKTVEMPSTVTSLPASCFSGCTALTTVSFPGITSLPNNCFDGCTALTSFSFTGIKTIGFLAFYNCSKLTDITIPSGATVGQRAFQYCTALTKLTIQEGATVGERAFQFCTGLKGELTIPKGTYNNRTFDGCTNVTELVIYTGSKISNAWSNYGCFGNMSSVTKVTLIDDGDHTIPAHFFGNASFSKDGVTLTIPESITAIGDNAFSSANFPTKLDLSKFTSYGVSAFEDNSAFRGNNGDGIIAVQKPASATSVTSVTVGRKAFRNTGATEIDIYPNVDYSACKPYDAYYAYGDGPYNGKGITKIVFESSITSIPDYVFFKASDIPSNCTVSRHTIKNVRGRDDWRICLCT